MKEMDRKSRWYNPRILPVLFAATFGLYQGDFTVKLQAQEKDLGTAKRYTLCTAPDCKSAKYYVGYQRETLTKLSGKTSELVKSQEVFYSNSSNIFQDSTLCGVTERRVDLEDGNYVSVVHRIDSGEIGASRKSELMSVHTSLDDAQAKAFVRLLWGDQIQINSKMLPKGTPVSVVIERTIGGFGNPATDNAFYEASFTTLVDGKRVEPLDFSLVKKAGPGEKDQPTGDTTKAYELKLKVGEQFLIESSMEVSDGVKVDPSSFQMLNGADSVNYKLSVIGDNAESVCLASASGKLDVGNCNKK